MNVPWKMNGWNPENHLGFQIFILGCTKSPSFSGVYHQKKKRVVFCVLVPCLWEKKGERLGVWFLGLNHPRNPGSQLLPFVTFWQTPNWRSRKFYPWSLVTNKNHQPKKVTSLEEPGRYNLHKPPWKSTTVPNLFFKKKVWIFLERSNPFFCWRT